MTRRAQLLEMEVSYCFYETVLGRGQDAICLSIV